MASKGRTTKRVLRQELEDTHTPFTSEDISGEGAEDEDQTRSQVTVTQLMEMMILQQQNAEERENRRWDEERIRREEERQQRLILEEKIAEMERRRREDEKIERLEREERVAEALISFSKNQERASKKPPKLAPLGDDEDPELYFQHFEQLMNTYEVPTNEWAHRIVSLLAGKALKAFHNDVSPTDAQDYDKIKQAILSSIGMTREDCRREWWRTHKKDSESIPEYGLRIQTWTERYVQNCSTREEVLHAFAIGKVLQDLPIGAAAYVREKGPKTLQEAVRLADNYIKDRQYHSSRGQPFRRWKAESTSTNRDYSQKEKAPGEKASDSHNKETGSKERTTEHSSGYGKHDRKNLSKYFDPEKGPLCFSCRHKGSECPKKVLKVGSPEPKMNYRVQGKVNGKLCNALKIDTGCAHTVVDASLVPTKMYTGKRVHLSAANRTPMDLPLAMVKFDLGGHSFTHEVAVMDGCAEQALLGSDLGILDQLIDLEREQRKTPTVGAVSTRHQVKEEDEQRMADKDATEQSGVTPTSLDGIFDFQDDFFQPGRERTKQTRSQK